MGLPPRSPLSGAVGRNHLYGSGLRHTVWMIRRFGLRRMLAKPVHMAMAPLMTGLVRPGRFTVRGETFDLFHHRYNTTWINERAVEVPVARRFLEDRGGRVLEVGNVMGHYGPADWDVVDRFEPGPRVRNCDVVEFRPEIPFDALLSISMIEHIGYDDERVDSGGRILAALAHMRDVCLAPAGRMLVTAPLGYNPFLDALAFAGRLGFDEQIFVKRTGSRAWREVPESEAVGTRYNSPHPYGNCVMFGYYRKPGEARLALR